MVLLAEYYLTFWMHFAGFNINIELYEKFDLI